MKILTTILLLMGLNNAYALSVNTTPTTSWNFNKTVEYWDSNLALVETIRNKATLISQNPNSLTAAEYYGLFILSKEGNEEERVMASEKLSAFCYNRAKTAETYDALNAEFGSNEAANARVDDCIKGEISPTITAKINQYYEYKYNKNRHEKIIVDNCLDIDYEDLKTENNTYEHFTKYSRGGILGVEPAAICDEYIEYKHKNLAVVSEVTNTQVAIGADKGYVETTEIFPASNYLQKSYEKYKNGVQGGCNEYDSRKARSHAQGPVRWSTDNDWGYFFCMRNPTEDINTVITEHCTSTNVNLVGGSYSPEKHTATEMCAANTWKSVGLLAGPESFWNIARSAWMQNQVEKYKTHLYNDGLDAQKASDSTKYWGNTLKHTDYKKNGYNFRSFIICPKAGVCEETKWSPSSARLANGGNKTSLYLKGRDKQLQTMWRDQPYAEPTAYTNRNYNTTSFEVNLPSEKIDTYNQSANILGTSKGFVSLSDTAERWLENEKDWVKSTYGYNCIDGVFDAYDDAYVLEKGETYVYSQKDIEKLKHGNVVAGREDSRAQKVIVVGEAGAQPHKNPVPWPYKVCNKR